MDGYIRYDTRLKQRARENRKNPTQAEQIAWDELFSNKQFFGYKFTRQKMLSGFIVDFYCSALQLVVEIDGEIHEARQEYDTERSYKLMELGLKVFRYSNNEIITNIEQVRSDLCKKLGFSFPLIRGVRGLGKIKPNFGFIFL